MKIRTASNPPPKDDILATLVVSVFSLSNPEQASGERLRALVHTSHGELQDLSPSWLWACPKSQ
jgi:hypothetical protein